jgi:uncharacterized membrane protein YqiK
MSSQSERANATVEAAVTRISELNARIVNAARQGGEESVKTYERMLENLADAQEAAGDRGSEWIREFARAQANFTRQLAEAFPALLQRLRARGRDLGADVTDRARQVPGVTEAEGVARGAVARERDLPIKNYDGLTVQEINRRLNGLSDIELTKVETYEARNKGRKTIRDRIATLRA